MAIPESVFKLLVFTPGEMLTLDAPVRFQDKRLDWPAAIWAGEAKKEFTASGLMTAPPPPPPPPDGEVTVTVV